MCQMTAVYTPFDALRAKATRAAGSVRAWRPWRRSATHPDGTTSVGVDPWVAASALLLEVAHAGGEPSEDACRYIHSAVRREFGLGADGARSLVRSAQAARAATPDPWRFSTLVVERLSVAQRMVLSEMMRILVRLQGHPPARGDYVLRKAASLLRLEAEGA
jgi:uncharacterized tellurite resistance protein B-like protein